MDHSSFYSLCRTSAFSRSTTRWTVTTKAAFPTVSSVSWMPACLLSSVLRTLEPLVSKSHPTRHTYIHTDRLYSKNNEFNTDITCKSTQSTQQKKAFVYSLSHATKERERENEEYLDNMLAIVGEERMMMMLQFSTEWRIRMTPLIGMSVNPQVCLIRLQPMNKAETARNVAVMSSGHAREIVYWPPLCTFLLCCWYDNMETNSCNHANVDESLP